MSQETEELEIKVAELLEIQERLEDRIAEVEDVLKTVSESLYWILDELEAIMLRVGRVL